MINVPDDFDWNIYLKLNLDLDENSDEIMCKMHYNNCGFYENRNYKIDVDKLPPNFNWKIYLELNPDINNNYNEYLTKQHYIHCGIFENRKYNINLPNNFNWKIYLAFNRDLPQSYNENECVFHYLNYGIYENRNYINLFYINFTCRNNNYNSDFNLNYTLSENHSLKLKNYINDFSSSIHVNKLSNIIGYQYGSQINIIGKQFNNEINIIDTIQEIKSFILIIDFSNGGGGTSYFLNTILSKYKYKQTFLIARNLDGFINITINDDYIFNKKYNEIESIEFIEENKLKISKIFINHIKGHNSNFLNKLFQINKEVTSITHDYSLLSLHNPQPYYHEINKQNITDNNFININNLHSLITQNIVNLNIYENFLDKNNNITEIIITPLPDYQKSLERVETNNEKYIIGFIGKITHIKGSSIINLINEFIQKNNYYMEIVIFGDLEFKNEKNNISNITYAPYEDINELNNLLKKYKPNVLVDASIWPETYSYTLTLAMITQLPILVLKKPYANVIENRLSKYPKTYYYDSFEIFFQLVLNVKQNFFYTIEPIIYYNNFWDNYFFTKKNKIVKNNIKNKYNINPYCIYFPQFHPFAENNKSFYPGFTDIENLHLLIKNNYNIGEIEQPSLTELNINSIHDYNLTNKSLIQKQIDIINDYQFSGFAIYYYWFSLNTITNKNMIMEESINNFFDKDINMKNRKVFFIWTNEDWSNNPAFGSSNEKIENTYNEENIKKNINNLMNYFKHENYLKIDNKPVFFIYHPWFLNNNEIDLLHQLLDIECKNNHFNGINFVLNNMEKDYKDYMNFSINFNYKNSGERYYNKINKKYCIDFKKYLNNANNSKNCIQTLVFDFDNSARLFQPNKLESSTTCENNTEFNKIIYMNKLIEKYNKNKNSDVENILLINAWNEWGEKMNVEPSKEYKYYYLNLLNEYINSY